MTLPDSYPIRHSEVEVERFEVVHPDTGMRWEIDGEHWQETWRRLRAEGYVRANGPDPLPPDAPEQPQAPETPEQPEEETTSAKRKRG